MTELYWSPAPTFMKTFPGGTWGLVLVGSKLEFWFSSSLPRTDDGKLGYGPLSGGRKTQVGSRASVNDAFIACA